MQSMNVQGFITLTHRTFVVKHLRKILCNVKVIEKSVFHKMFFGIIFPKVYANTDNP